MRTCTVCGKDFDPDRAASDPAEEAGAIMAREQWGDDGQLCLTCLASRGTLGMMYCREFSG
ncbi:MAG: hypothetical protein C0617_01225 [Desulfuromonas sp.]|uniref:hypothetical protein n=1 Tax=Desulfuromonas sp. TaxID=892 RepID=UPI000CBFA233|nr:hypothetical protein [Desulfuromonas sp.]PLX86234.1 MAG: hypothetical protein C0617_01225 [Desulfuromonas sp.]